MPEQDTIQNKLNLFPVPVSLFIGPQRSGTSWLYRYLSNRGDISLPHDVKEIFFFDDHFERGPNYYRSHFKIDPQHKLATEITTTAFAHPQAPERIFNYFGKDIRLICPLREPVIRSYSLYRHFKRYGMVKGTIEEAVKEKPEIIETSRYANYLKNWFDIFGRKNIHFTFQEHLALDQEGYVKKISEFLEIPHMPVPPELSGGYNNTATPPCYLIAKTAQKTANLLRKLKLYGIINAAKSLGAKKYVFGDANPDTDPITIPESDRKFLEHHLKNEVQKLEELLQYKIKCWEK
jgi:hypothetical protein